MLNMATIVWHQIKTFIFIFSLLNLVWFSDKSQKHRLCVCVCVCWGSCKWWHTWDHLGAQVCGHPWPLTFINIKPRVSQHNNMSANAPQLPRGSGVNFHFLKMISVEKILKSGWPGGNATNTDLTRRKCFIWSQKQLCVFAEVEYLQMSVVRLKAVFPGDGSKEQRIFVSLEVVSGA